MDSRLSQKVEQPLFNVLAVHCQSTDRPTYHDRSRRAGHGFRRLKTYKQLPMLRAALAAYIIKYAIT